MTNPVILLGTQSNGETLPVQVDATGRLVAEGLLGPAGPEGPVGPQGPPGPGGGMELPPNEFEGAVLGWKNNDLAWLSPTELILPDGVFGPIESWDAETNQLTVVGGIPPEVMAGAEVYQCTLGGNVATTGWNHDLVWSSYVSNGVPDSNPLGFNGELDNGFRPQNMNSWADFVPPEPIFFNQLKIQSYRYGPSGADYSRYKLVGSSEVRFSYCSGNPWCVVVDGPNYLESVGVYFAFTDNFYTDQLCAIEIDGRILVDPVHSLKLTVDSVLENTITGTPNQTIPFQQGLYLKVPQAGRRISLREVITTTDIDSLRQIRD